MFIRRPRRCARTSSGPWPGLLACPLTCHGPASPRPRVRCGPSSGWNRLRFEVTEDASPGCDGVRHCYTPTLGLFTAVTGGNGDIMVPEGRVRTAMAMAQTESDLRREMDRLLGRAWDEELEPFRYAGDGAPVRWLHRVG